MQKFLTLCEAVLNNPTGFVGHIWSWGSQFITSVLESERPELAKVSEITVQALIFQMEKLRPESRRDLPRVLELGLRPRCPDF